jgi:site-specific DNA recombinase
MKALIYVRVSTTEQVDNYSLETQERSCREYCERRGLEVVEVYRDEGHSAKTTDRPALQRLLATCTKEAKSCSISAVVIYKVDRLARKVVDHLATVATLKTVGVDVHAVMENFDDSPSGLLMENLLAAMAQFDNDARAERTIAGMREGARRGRWMWRPPLGYRKGAPSPSASLVPDPDAAALLADGFEAIASGRLSRPAALRELTAHGLRTRGGRVLSSQTFHSTLKKPIYKGRILKPEWDIDVPGDFEPLVTAAVFDTVQDILDGKKPTRSHTRDHPDFPLRRVVRCGRCTKPLTGSWSKGRNKHYPYYRCPKGRCGNSIPKDKLEDLVLERLADMTVSPEILLLLKAIVEDTWKKRTASTQEQQHRLEKDERKLQKRLDGLTDKYLDGQGIDQHTYEEQKQRISEELTGVRTAQAETTIPAGDITSTIDFAQRLLGDLPGCWNRLQPLERTQFLLALLPAGFTYTDGTVGTTENPWWIKANGVPAETTSSLVPRTGFEPVLPP